MTLSACGDQELDMTFCVHLFIHPHLLGILPGTEGAV